MKPDTDIQAIIKPTMSHRQDTSKIKEEFDREVNRCFQYAESLEDLLNQKIKTQEKDNLNPDHLKDLQKANVLLAMVVNLLDEKS